MAKNLLLISKDVSYVVYSDKDFHTKDGVIKAKDLAMKNFGDKVKTHLGKEFLIVKPTILDILHKKVKRTAQVILPKDIALFLAYTGIGGDSMIVDAGTGSGYSAIFLANFLPNGKIVTYETSKEFAQKAKENIVGSGLKNIVFKRKDVTKGIAEKNVDLVLLDLQESHKAVKHAYRSLRVAGWLVIYSPTIESLIKNLRVIKKLNFSDVKTVENIVREWQTERTVRPKTMGLMHTGFLTFARKVG